MRSSRRIAFNTAATYSRTVVSVLLALLSSRWVLAALGQTDFGLYMLVGALIVFVTFINNTMAQSVARHYAYAIGQGEPGEVSRWFNTAVSLHLVVGLGLILVGWPIGELVISHVLTIPADRVSASLWVFRLSLISAFASMISMPFVAMFRAQQRLGEIALWGMVYAVLTFVVALFLDRAPGDRLVWYAVGMVAALLLIQLAQVGRALAVFRECRFDRAAWFERGRFKAIVSFGGWNLFAALGVLFRNQGSAFLINLYFGPKVNAAFGIANQVVAKSNQLATAMLTSFAPEVTACEGRGERARMLDLAQRANKGGAILALLFAVPVISEIDYLLRLWLIEPPQYSALLCTVFLVAFVVDRLSSGYMLAVQAHGKIAGYQATMGGSLIMTLPLVLILFALGLPPPSVGAAFIATTFVVAVGRVFWVRRLLGVPVTHWIAKVVLPISLVAVAGFSASLGPGLAMPESLGRLALSALAGLVAVAVVTWLAVFDNRERVFVKNSLARIRKKMLGPKSGQ